MTTMKDFKETRGRIIHEMREITDNPKGDGGDLSKEQAERFDTLKADLESTEKRMERQALVDEAERRMQGEQLTGSGDEHLDRELRDYSLIRAIRSQIPNMAGDFGREREIHQELCRRSGRNPEGLLVPMSVFEKRVVTTAAPGAGPGSNLVSTDHLGNQYIDILRSKLVTRRLGARVLRDLKGDVSIPKRKASSTTAWIAENGELSATDAQFTAITMSPKHVGVLQEMSRNMLQQTSPDLEQLTREDFSFSLADAVDKGAIASGASNEPTGILGTSGVNTVSMSGGPTWAKILECIMKIEQDDSEGNGWLATPEWVKLLRSTPKEVDGSDVAVSADYLMEGPGSLAGYPLVASNIVPKDVDTDKHALIFGKWSDLLLGYWSELEILVNPYESTAYKKGNIQVRGLLTMDVAVRHPESFCTATGLDPEA